MTLYYWDDTYLSCGVLGVALIATSSIFFSWGTNYKWQEAGDVDMLVPPLGRVWNAGLPECLFLLLGGSLQCVRAASTEKTAALQVLQMVPAERLPTV